VESWEGDDRNEKKTQKRLVKSQYISTPENLKGGYIAKVTRRLVKERGVEGRRGETGKFWEGGGRESASLRMRGTTYFLRKTQEGKGGHQHERKGG